jgi:hypothetical protein
VIGALGLSEEYLGFGEEDFELIVMYSMARVRDFDQSVVFDDLRAPVRFRVRFAPAPTKS